MKKMFRVTLLILFLSISICLCVSACASAAEETKPQVIKLWPGKAPESKGDTPLDNPEITLYLPAADINTKAAILVCPGGGYRRLAMRHEGTQVAEWLNSIGVAAAVLKYRLPENGYKHPHPLADAQRAIRILRSNAEKYNLDPAKIGVMGFSAGGHLASTVATLFKNPQNMLNDELDKLSPRPDFAVLVYPCITIVEKYRYGGMPILLTDPKSQEQAKALSSELNVTPETPPTILFHSDADRGVKPLNSIAFYAALYNNKVPAELHIYDGGSHGWGMSGVGKGKNNGASNWTRDLQAWMTQRNIIPAK